MGLDRCVVSGLHRYLPWIRFLGGLHVRFAMAGGPVDGPHTDGPEHRDVGQRDRGWCDDPGAREPENARPSFWERLEPADALGGIGMIGLIVYALVRGMDATTASMLTGLLGVLVGRKTRNRNGCN